MQASSSTSSSEPRRLALHALLFLLGLVLLDQGLGWTLRTGLSRIHTGEGSGQANAALAATDRDVVFFGSSRCVQHFDPSVFEEVTGHRGYNAGANGQGIVYAEMLAALMIARDSQAQTFVLHVDAQDLFDPHVDRASVLLPWESEAPVIAERLASEDRWLRLKLLSATYPFNSMALPILRNLLSSRAASPDGFSPLDHGRGGVAGVPAADTSEEELAAARALSVDPLARRVLRSFVERARDAGIATVFVTAPLSIGIEGPTPVSARDVRRERGRRALERMASGLGVTYLSFDERSTPSLDDASLFNDPGHMNRAGAERLTRLLAARMQAEASP